MTAEKAVKPSLMKPAKPTPERERKRKREEKIEAHSNVARHYVPPLRILIVGEYRGKCA